MNLFFTVLRHWFSKRFDNSLALLCFFIDFIENGSKMLVDILLENFSQSLGKRSRSKEFHIHVSINIMIFEVFIFFVQGHPHFYLVVNILLRSVLDSHISELQRNFSVQYHAGSISSSVHDINFSDDTQGSGSFRIPLPSQMQPLRSTHVSVGRNNS